MFKCKDSVGNVNKESCPKYTCTHPKSLLKTIKQLKLLEQLYNWHSEDSALNGGAGMKWSAYTCAWVTSAARYNMKYQDSWKTASDPEFLMMEKMLDDKLHTEVVLAALICHGKKQCKCFWTLIDSCATGTLMHPKFQAFLHYEGYIMQCD